MDKHKLIEIYKALSDITRFEIVNFIILAKKEVGCCKIIENFNLSQPTLSHHCSKLEKAGVLKCRKEGTAKYYSINEEIFGEKGLCLSESFEKIL